MRTRGDEGQAATELALVVPLLVLLLLALVQVTLVARDQILLVHAAREAAREASVDRRPHEVRAAAIRAAGPGLKVERLRVEVRESGGARRVAVVRIEYSVPTEVPLLGPLLPDIPIRAKAAMHAETFGIERNPSDHRSWGAGTAVNGSESHDKSWFPLSHMPYR